VLVILIDDVWELYNGNTDWTQSKDLSKENPEKLHELQRLWLIEAVKYNVLPLDDRQAERFIPEVAGAHADQGQLAVAVRGHGAALGEQCRRHQEQVMGRHR
jgi:hypothetical protein